MYLKYIFRISPNPNSRKENIVRLTNFSDYSLRVLIYLATKQEKSSIAEVSRTFCISENHLAKIVHKLSTLGYVHSIRGKHGGIKLGMDPTKINLGKIIVALEPDFDIVECFNEDRDACSISPVCRLKTYFNKAKKAFLATLGRYTLANVIKNKSELVSILCPK